MPEPSETDVPTSPTSPPLPPGTPIPPSASTVSFLPDGTIAAGCDSLLTDNGPRITSLWKLRESVTS